MGKEIEEKFQGNAKIFQQIQEDFPGFSPISMETTYYDTKNRLLASRRITLRRRLENGISVCTVKTPAENGARGEWEVLCEEISQAAPMLCKLGCPQDLSLWVRDGLFPLCGAKFTRLATEIATVDFTAELALDQGTLFASGNTLPLWEVELELISGDCAAFLAYCAQFAEKYRLNPEEKSKFQRALSLAEGE